MLRNGTGLEKFYETLTDKQKEKVEAKLKRLIGESEELLPKATIRVMRWQIASDMFYTERLKWQSTGRNQ